MEINTIDKENMRQVIVDSPLQLKAGQELAKNIKAKGSFSNVIICAIGGSAWPTSLINTLQITTRAPMHIYRSYGLPAQANQDSLIICISYSGNTEEPVSTLKEAIDRKLSILCIASGGEVELLCEKNNIPLVKIPSGIQPRSATGYIFSAFVQLLANSGIIEDASSELLETSKKLEEANATLEQSGKELAEKLFEKIPIIYTSDNVKELAMIWKIKFNENSKIPAFHNYFPELNHNEMVGYTGLQKLGAKNFCVIMLEDSTAHPRILKRMQLTADIIKNSGAEVQVVPVESGSLSFRIFSSLLLGDWTSYYLALEQKIDPTPVQMVEEFKGLMEK